MSKKVELKAAQRLVLGMTYARGEAESKITDLGYEFAQHVMKVYVFSHTSYLPGWFNELRAWYKKIQFIGSRLKGGKEFKAASYTDFMLEPILWRSDRFHSRIEDLIEDNPKIKPRPDLDTEKMFQILKEFYAELGKCIEAGEEWTTAQKLLMDYVQR